jgi:small conductance mechanosensitive channel
MWQDIWSRFLTKFGPTAMAQYLGSLLPRLISALITLAFMYLLWRIVSRVVRTILARFEVDETLRAFVQTLLRSVMGVVAAISALSELGIDTTSLLTSLGIAGLTIGFAAKDTLSNLISGLFIFWDRPFVLGDLIEINGQYGRVDQITLRSTRIVTVDGKMLALPNGSVVNSAVASYTNFPNLRIQVDLTVGVGEDLNRIRALFLELVGDDDRFLADPKPSMVVTSINDFNVAVQFRAWLIDEKTHVAVRFELRERIFETMRSAGVDMPFETLVVHTNAPAA